MMEEDGGLGLYGFQGWLSDQQEVLYALEWPHPKSPSLRQQLEGSCPSARRARSSRSTEGRRPPIPVPPSSAGSSFVTVPQTAFCGDAAMARAGLHHEA